MTTETSKSAGDVPAKSATNNRSFKIKAALFLTGVTGVSAVVGFGATLVAVKKQDPKYFEKGLTSAAQLSETGAGLALRALGYGTLLAFSGCGLLFFSIWKLSGAKSLEEFRYKMGSVLPRLSKTENTQGRTEFSGLTDLLDYLQHQKSTKDN